MSKNPHNDKFFMKRALDLAKKGAGRVAPNPMVGAVLVKNNKILAEGFHEFFGGPHAEVNTLRKVTKNQIRGATLYVTLEPCCYFGKTPPCTNFLISSGVKYLVLAMRDPNPLVAGKGIKQLKKSGVNVRTGVLEHEAKTLNKVFIKNTTKGLPFVSIKLGTSLNGKITTGKANLQYITNELSRKDVHRYRSRVDAIITTSETVLNDNPHLGVRLVRGKDPLRVVIDSRLRTKLDATVYRDGNVIVATTTRCLKSRRKAFEKKKIRLLVYKGSKVPLFRLLKDLYKIGVYHVMVEAGSGLVTSLLNEKLADEMILYIAPKIFAAGISWIGDEEMKPSRHMPRLADVEHQSFGDDIMIKGVIVYS